ncbi:MAG: hypothetical protein R6U32_06285 [Candidatus Woesearchaeota archaeon]
MSELSEQGKMDMIQEAFTRLYPDREFNYSARIRYTDRFKDYGANIKLRGNELEFGLSRKWKTVSREIRIGLLQELMLKLFSRGSKSGRRKRDGGKDIDTMHIDLYNSFVRNLHIAAPKDKSHPMLEESFDRVNERYFYSNIERPNLVWGGNSTTSLGSYDFKTDTIKISGIFTKIAEKDPALLDFIMHHEILHKAHKFRSRNGRSTYHDREFRRREKEFEDYEEVDKRLKRELKKTKIKKMFLG